MDWSGGSKNLEYPTACANTQVAGRSIAYLFNQLKKAGFRNSDFNCAGHSLGSHVCSYAAKVRFLYFNKGVTHYVEVLFSKI